jgi:hypothetical protein
MRISERMLVVTGSLLFALGCAMGGWMLAAGAVSWWVSSGLAFSLAHRDRTGLASLKLFAVGSSLAMWPSAPNIWSATDGQRTIMVSPSMVVVALAGTPAACVMAAQLSRLPLTVKTK